MALFALSVSDGLICNYPSCKYLMSRFGIIVISGNTHSKYLKDFYCLILYGSLVIISQIDKFLL